MSRLILLGAALLLALPCRADDPPPSDPTNVGPAGVDPAKQDLNSLTLEQLMQVKVVSAALHPQTLQDAPASVTIITAEDIRKYGYRTLGEALAAVRGFYLNNDRTYETVGVRGFDLPGDYSSHILVMVNGYNMADNIFDYMLYLGNDFPIDMNLIKQIEIIRGPASALYGSNAIFATINIVTKSPGEAGPLALTADTGSFGEKKGQIVETASFGGVKFLVSGSVFNNTGESPLFFPQFNTPQNNYGEAIDMNGEKGYHFFSTLVWRNWTVTAAFAGHDQVQPISWGPTIFNNRGTTNADNRDFVDAVYDRQVAGGALRWRIYYDSFHNQGRDEYALSGGGVEDNRTNLSVIGPGPKLRTASVPPSLETSPRVWRPTLISEISRPTSTCPPFRSSTGVTSRKLGLPLTGVKGYGWHLRSPTNVEVATIYIDGESPVVPFQDELKVTGGWDFDLSASLSHSRSILAAVKEVVTIDRSSISTAVPARALQRSCRSSEGRSDWIIANGGFRLGWSFAPALGDLAEHGARHQARAARIIEVEQAADQFARRIKAADRLIVGIEHLAVGIDAQAAERKRDAAGDRVALERRRVDGVRPIAFGDSEALRAAAVLDVRIERHVDLYRGVVVLDRLREIRRRSRLRAFARIPRWCSR